MNKPIEYVKKRIADYEQWIKVGLIGDDFSARIVADKYGPMSVEFDRKLTEHIEYQNRLALQLELLEWMSLVIKEGENLE